MSETNPTSHLNVSYLQHFEAEPSLTGTVSTYIGPLGIY